MLKIISELNRRNVSRVALAYAVASWVLIEVTSVVLPAFDAPGWILRVVIIMLVAGFPLALIFSWVYELTPEGLKKESEIGPEQSITGHTARKLNVVVIILLLVAIGLFALDRFVLEKPVIATQANPGSAMGTAQDSPPAAANEATPSLAVLAFENMSADAENEYFADGISEEILNLLADVNTLSVASRTSAFAFKGKDTPIPEIASTLNVRYVLEGSVRKAGEQVRVTAQLIDASTDRHLWSETFDRKLEDIFLIQDEIAASIGQALQVQLLGEGGSQVKAEEIDPDTFALFLEARHVLRERSRAAIRKANEMLIRVVEAEPGFGRAHVLLGEAYILNLGSRNRDSLLPDDLAVSQAHMHAGIARMLNPRLSGIDLIIGAVVQRRGDWVASLDHYNRAIELEPNEPRPYHWRAGSFGAAGYIDECLADVQIAKRLDPENLGVSYLLAACNFARGDADEALRIMRESVQSVENANWGLLEVLELAAGDFDAAEKTAERVVQSPGWEDSEDPGYWSAAVKRARAAPGDAVQMAPTRDQYQSANFGILQVFGDKDAYLIKLEENDSSPSGMMMIWQPKAFEIRRDPRFVQNMERFGITRFWHDQGPPPDCRAEGDTFTCGLVDGK